MAAPQRIASVVIVLAVVLAVGLSLLNYGVYGWTLFCLIPAAAGGAFAWIRRPATAGRAAANGALAGAGSALLLLLLGREGLICIVMALPLVVPLGAVGGVLAYHAQRSNAAAPGVAMLLLLAPATLTWDVTAPPPVFKVHSQMEVAASPEQVWKYVIAFPPLPQPREWFFRAGVAYPERARIEGFGPGAVRYCEFSTGPFVEPIEVWDEPRRLQFRVTDNPSPLRELSPYGPIQPKHLHGYLVSKRGEFRLTALPNGHTLLEGTTWYQHGLWPAEYWRWWSDAIIHRIHLRVLNHVRRLAEQEARRGEG